MTKSRSSVMLFIIIMAILLAIVVFLAISILLNRSGDEAGLETAPEGQAVPAANMVTVANELITLQVDPNLRVQIVDVVNEAPPVVEQPADNQPPVEEPIVEGVDQPTPIPPTPVTEGQPAPTAPQPVVIQPAAEKIIFTPYTVQANDTLYSIGQRIDTTIALMAEYGIAADNLSPGTVIELPIGNPAYCANNGRPYAVREGDTAYSIAVRFNTSAEQLQMMNNLDANFTVRVSDIICVP